MSLHADETIALLVYSGTVIAAHMTGRHREAKPVVALGRSWDIVKIKPAGGALLVELRARPSDGPLMCSRCGSFEWDRPGGAGGPFECQAAGCGHRSHRGEVTF